MNQCCFSGMTGALLYKGNISNFPPTNNRFRILSKVSQESFYRVGTCDGVLWSLTSRGRWDTVPKQKSKNLESFKGCHENTTQLHFFFFLHWLLLTYTKGGKKWAPKLCVLVLILIKTWIQITGELFQGIRFLGFFWWVFCVCLFLY